MSASPDEPAAPFKRSRSSFRSDGAFLQKVSRYSASAWQKQWKQNGQSLVALLALQAHQMAVAASNSPRQDQHWVAYSRGTHDSGGERLLTPGGHTKALPRPGEYRVRNAYLQETEGLGNKRLLD